MSETGYVMEKVFQETTKRIDEENRRQNERIASLEHNTTIVQQLSIHMERLATNMETMAKELSRQGSKLSELEMKPAKRWELIVTGIITAIIGTLVGFIANGVLP